MSLTSKLRNYQDANARLVALIDEMTEAQRYYKHTPEEWSAIEVAHHLSTSEYGILQQVQTPHPKARKQTLKGNLRNLALRAFMKSGKKAKAPSRLPQPDNSIAWEKLRGRLTKVAAEYDAVVAALPTDKQGYTVFKHPRAGLLTMSQTLDFLADHIKHHLPQVQRTRERAIAAAV